MPARLKSNKIKGIVTLDMSDYEQTDINRTVKT